MTAELILLSTIRTWGRWVQILVQCCGTKGTQSPWRPVDAGYAAASKTVVCQYLEDHLLPHGVDAQVAQQVGAWAHPHIGYHVLAHNAWRFRVAGPLGDDLVWACRAADRIMRMTCIVIAVDASSAGWCTVHCTRTLTLLDAHEELIGIVPFCTKLYKAGVDMGCIGCAPQPPRCTALARCSKQQLQLYLVKIMQRVPSPVLSTYIARATLCATIFRWKLCTYNWYLAHMCC